MDSPSPTPDSKPADKPAKTWDLPTRVTHWVLALLILAALITAEYEELFDPSVIRHRTIGLVILAVVLFRLLWGFFGNAQARFKNFPLFPLGRVKEDVLTLRSGGKMRRWVGHSPIGSWSAVLLLSLIGLQAVTGLMTKDDIPAAGPLVYHLPASVIDVASFIHYTLPKFFVPLILIHILAVLWHEIVKKHRITGAMFFGYRPHSSENQGDTPKEEAERPVLALALLFLAALVSFGFYLLY